MSLKVELEVEAKSAPSDERPPAPHFVGADKNETCDFKGLFARIRQCRETTAPSAGASRDWTKRPVTTLT
jgi:hypothetical protein